MEYPAPLSPSGFSGFSFVVASAACYTVAMLAMKWWGSVPMGTAVPVIVLALLGAVAFEILALRDQRLGLVYVAILGVECVMIAGVSHFVLGESFSAREVAGAALIAAGTALAWA